MPPEAPAPLGVLLAQDLLLSLALLLRAQVAVLLLQEPHGRPALLLKVPLVNYTEKEREKQGAGARGTGREREIQGGGARETGREREGNRRRGSERDRERERGKNKEGERERQGERGK